MASTPGVSQRESQLAPRPAREALAGGLGPSEGLGWVHLLATCALSAGGLWGALGAGWGRWGVGQALLALAGLRWFLVLHEASHGTLFHTRSWNRVAAGVGGLWSWIPPSAWRSVHARHHQWTGWEDRDPTRARLSEGAPRGALAGALEVCWRLGLPLIALLYRRSYWRELSPVGRLEGASILVVWGAGLAWCGAGALAPGVLLGLALQEWLILSQHSHLPQDRAGDARVRPHSAAEQDLFTRSLIGPAWLSWLLIGAEAHSLHHRLPQVPGYRLRRLGAALAPPRHAESWLDFLVTTRAHSAREFLFRSREGCPACASPEPGRASCPAPSRP